MHRCYAPGHDFGVSINTYMTDSLYRVVSSPGSKFISKKSRFGTTRGARVGSVSRREVLLDGSSGADCLSGGPEATWDYRILANGPEGEERKEVSSGRKKNRRVCFDNKLF
ncbi:uncharacterized protein [Physcomitrium patens]|uniref:uncharacterized protein n=1 Tax=Physcomitrium patens TaxID=3218 RepID=UPI003CCDDA90